MLLTADADAAATQTLECLKNIDSLLHEINSQRNRLLHKRNNIMNSLEKVTLDDKVSPYFQRKLKNLRNTAVAATTALKRVKEIMRKSADKIKVVRARRNDRRIQARETANEETYILLIEQDLCNAALTDIQQAEEIMRNALYEINKVHEATLRLIRHNTLMKMLLLLQSTAETLPLYVGEAPGVKLPALCGAIPAESTYIAETGDMVAALVEDENPGMEN